jgi:flagellar biosynthesis/type III secretory pathway M-ring protein FliF/YscJ
VQVAQRFPTYASEITAGAAQAFAEAKSSAVLVALVMVLIGLVLVLAVFPRKAAEDAYYAAVAQETTD